MSEFTIQPQNVKNVLAEKESIAKQLNDIAGKVEAVASAGALGDSGYANVRSALRNIASNIRTEKGNVSDMKNALEQIIQAYEEAERNITNNAQMRKEFNQTIKSLEKQLDEVGNNGGGTSQDSNDYDGDPVNMCNGNFVEEVQELKIAGRIPLEFTRVYNAMGGKETVMGMGWSCNYMDHLEKKGENLHLLEGDGREEIFAPIDTISAEIRYLSVFGSYEEIIETEDGFRWKKEEEEYFFNKQGKLVSYQKSTVGSLNFCYEGEQLVQVNREDGASLSYVYQEDGKLAKVKDHTGREILFSYEKGQLAEVIATDGTKTAYAYDEKRRLKSITNAIGVKKVTNTYDKNGRVLKQDFADGEMMQYEYQDEEKRIALIERNGAKTVYVHDEKNRHVKTIHEDGEESFSYNEKNKRVFYTDPMGNSFQRTFDNRGNITSVIDEAGNITHYTYDANNHLVSFKDPFGNQTVYRYDSKGNMTEAIAADGTSTQISYNEQNQPQKVINPDGSKIEISYDGAGNILAVAEEGKGTTSYRYDNLNRVIASIDGEGNETCYAYDAKDRIVAVTNAEGRIRSYTYQELGKITALNDFDGNEESWEYGVIAKPLWYKDKAGRSTFYEYDAMRNVSKVVAPNGAESFFTYNKKNQLASMTNPLGHTIFYTYDANGNCVEQTDEVGNKKKFTYNANNQLTSVTDEVGAVTTMEYNALGKLIAKRLPNGSCETYRYDSMNRIIEKTDVIGNAETYTYTSLGNVHTVVDAAGRKIEYDYYPGDLVKSMKKSNGEEEHYTYNANGMLATKRNAAGYELSYRYDSLNRMTDIFSNEGQHKSYTYDAMGNCTSMTDANGNVTTYAYSVTGKLTAVIDAEGNSTYYNYDEMDQLTGILQSEGVLDPDFAEAAARNEENHKLHLTTYQRDLAGRVVSITDPLGATEYFTYDAAGRVIGKKDRDGFDTTYCYAPDGMVSEISYADGKRVEFTYDALKKVQKIKDWLGTIQIQNDVVGRPVRVTDQQGKEVQYAYGKAGERTQVVYPDGSKVDYTYDAALKLCAVTAAAGVTTFAYDAFGRLTEKVLPNQVRTSYEYNQANFLTGLTHEDEKGILDCYQFQYDAMENKIAVKKERRGLAEESGSYAYRYDAIGRLIQVERNEKMLRSYQYDGFGNRTAVFDDILGKREYHYNCVDRLTEMVDVEQQKTYGYDYDHRGNRISESVNGQVQKQYEFSPMNRLEKLTTPSGVEKVYTYNGVGQRVGEASQQNQISYVLDLTRNYHNLLQREEKGSVESFTWAGSVLGRQSADKNEFFLQDEMGSVTRFLDAEGEVLASYGYDEFGNDLSDGMPQYARQGTWQPFGYTGYRMDTESGLYFAQAREYSPLHGQFISEDLVRGFVEAPVTLNHYGYCWNNPEKLVDLDGRWPTWDDVKDFCNKYILGEETVIVTTTGDVDGGAGFYAGENIEKTTSSDTYTGSILKHVAGIENGSLSDSYSINIPSIDFGDGVKVGIPISIGVTTSEDGVSLSADVGIDLGKLNINVPAEIGLSWTEIVSLGVGVNAGWGDNSVGLDIGLGVSPFSNIKMGGHQTSVDGDTAVTSKGGIYMRTGYVYSVVVAAYALYACANGAMDPGVAWQYMQQYINSLITNGLCPIM